MPPVWYQAGLNVRDICTQTISRLESNSRFPFQGHWPSSPLVLIFFLPFQLTAFGGFLKYTISYDIPVEATDSNLMAHADVIIKVLPMALF